MYDLFSMLKIRRMSDDNSGMLQYVFNIFNKNYRYVTSVVLMTCHEVYFYVESMQFNLELT